MTDQPDIQHLLDSLRRAIDADRRFFVSAKTDPAFDHVRTDVDGLLDDLVEQAQERATRSIRIAESAVREMEEWHASRAAESDYKAAKTAMVNAVRRHRAGSYYGYLDSFEEAGTAEKLAQRATESQRSEMKRRIDRLENVISEFDAELLALPNQRYKNEKVASERRFHDAQARSHDSYTTYSNYESALGELLAQLKTLRSKERQEARLRTARDAKASELGKLRQAMGLLLLSVVFVILPLFMVVVAGNSDQPPDWFQWTIFTLIFAAVPLSMADSIWDLGKKRPAEKFSAGYLWLILSPGIVIFVSLYRMFTSYPASVKAIRERYPKM